MKLSKLRTDPALERGGNWVPVGDGLQLKVARLGNPAYQADVMARMKSLGIKAEDPEEVHRQVEAAMAKHILLDWDGLIDDDEKAIPYTPGKAKELLALTDFYKLVENTASRSDNFRTAGVKEAVGNSEPVSTGS